MKAFSLLFGLLVFSGSWAQENKVAPVSSDLNGQYKALSATCDLVEGVRVVKLYKMDQLWKGVQDTLHTKDAIIVQLQKDAAKQKGEMAALKTSLQKSDSEKASLTTAVDNLFVFGKEYSKAGFVSVMLIIIAGLIALVVFLVLMYKVAFSNAREFRKLNETLNHEFEEYKHQTIEKQIKLSRELQDYRNRMAELKLKSA